MEELRAQALQHELAASREWHVLLHYREDRLGGGVTSLADSDNFFFAPDGKTNPQAELEATLAAFLDPDARLRNDEHPQCVFVARRAFLDRNLGLDRARLPWRPCPEYDEWRTALGAAGLSLIFAEAFMNNPASMFGHTLLRLDRLPPGDDRTRRDLLAYVVNFAGETGMDTGALYAIKGIVGAYPGYFSLVPYYDKVNQYGNWEARDLWEYRLDLSPEEVERLLLHLWELRDVAFQYFFFSENCSYELLGLIEAARPEVDLRGRFGGWVVPVDTVRAILEEAGLAGEVVWRPSSVTRIRSEAEPLDGEQQRLALAVSEGRLPPDAPEIEALAPEPRAAVLALAHDHLQQVAESRDREASARGLAILRERSRVPVTGDPAPPPERPTTRPDEGHGTARMQLAGGWLDGRSFVELRARPAFHDLLDAMGGFVPGAQIDFLQGALRFYPDDNEVTLQEMTLIEITSLAPRDLFFKPVSWKFRTGYLRRLLPSKVSDDLRESGLWRTTGGAGLTWNPFGNALLYTFADATFDVSGKLDDSVGLGFGASTGIYFGDEGDRWRGHLFGQAMSFVAGDTRTFLAVGFEQRLRLTRNTALEARVAWERDFSQGFLDARLAWSFYF